MDSGMIRAKVNDLHVGDIIIYEAKHYDYKTGRPRESEYFRTIVGERRTVAGAQYYLTAEPDWEYPAIPPWPAGWIWAGNHGETGQMWRKERER